VLSSSFAPFTLGVTALLACEKGKIGEGSKVVIRGASGGVGSLAVQIARSMGAGLVIGISSATELVTGLGAHECLDYKEEPDYATKLVCFDSNRALFTLSR
jgi:NADPH:quinone reductase-like Zn-dependent oxidoreductase